MQLPIKLLEAIKSGKITISQNDKPAIEVRAADKRLDINTIDKDFIKEIMSSARGASSKQGVIENLKKSFGTISQANTYLPLLKTIAEQLCSEDFTVTVSYKGDRVLTIGAEADSKFTRFVTGTKGIEINSPLKLAEMGL